MSEDQTDPVDAVILAFLDYLEGVAPRPSLEHLSEEERAYATVCLEGMAVARGLDPYGTRPSVEALLADTPLSPLLAAIPAAGGDEADLATVRGVLAGVDSRARVEVDGSPDGCVVFGYLDLRARFVLVPGVVPVVTEAVRDLVRRIFSDDPDTSRVGVVAAHSGDLATQLLAADEIGAWIATAHAEPRLRWDRPLPLALAARRMLEQSAPEWPAFDFGGADQRGNGDQARGDVLDVTSLAAEIARRVIARESERSYRGDKRRAYQALVGQEALFADLVARVTAPGTELNLDAETTRITRAAA
jgi:hypothetical protein